jgi:hypothetical protein
MMVTLESNIVRSEDAKLSLSARAGDEFVLNSSFILSKKIIFDPAATPTPKTNATIAAKESVA